MRKIKYLKTVVATIVIIASIFSVNSMCVKATENTDEASWVWNFDVSNDELNNIMIFAQENNVKKLYVQINQNISMASCIIKCNS